MSHEGSRVSQQYRENPRSARRNPAYAANARKRLITGLEESALRVAVSPLWAVLREAGAVDAAGSKRLVGNGPRGVECARPGPSAIPRRFPAAEFSRLFSQRLRANCARSGAYG